MKDPINKTLVLLVTLGVTALFLSMIKGFLLTILFAALFSGLAWPMNTRLEKKLKGKKGLASIITIVLLLLIIIIPTIGFLSILVGQAVKAGQSYAPWVQENLTDEDQVIDFLESIPLVHKVFPEHDELITKMDQAIDHISEILVSGLSMATQGTAQFLFLTFILLYTMFFFLKDGDRILYKVLYYFPLKHDQEKRLLEKFTTVTRATIKGTLIIGVIQGGLAGVAMALAGIPYTVFWGTIMAVLSVIPAIGPALVWLPAGLILLATGNTWPAIGLMAFCAIIVGNIDNVLRPILVGKDTAMPELMIFLGTLGGIALFGISGVVIGPLVSAIFITVWDIYGITFKEYLPEVPMQLKEEMHAGQEPEEKP
jgi:predicted PurR-regulated permease PerM